MRTFGLIVVGAIVVVIGVIAWWWAANPTYVHRFRLVIEAEADGLPRTGSSVIEVRTTDYNVGLPEMLGLRSRVQGEAVFVDLGNGTNVIAILGFGPTGSDDWIAGLTESAFLPSHPGLRYWDVPTLTGTAPAHRQVHPDTRHFHRPQQSKNRTRRAAGGIRDGFRPRRAVQTRVCRNGSGRQRVIHCARLAARSCRRAGHERDRKANARDYPPTS